MAIVEEVRGRGSVSRDSSRLFETDYLVVVDREQVVAQALTHTEVLEGLDDITGRIRVNDSQAWNLMQQPEGLRLHLDDGRTLLFLLVNDRGDIVGNGWE